MRLAPPSERTGSVLPLVVVSLVGLLGCVALAIDVGMLMVSRTECQVAADSGAMAAARTLNGDVARGNNSAAASANAVTAATNCTVLSKPVAAGSVSCEIGYYSYDRTTSKFGPILPSTGASPPANENMTLARVQVSSSNPTAFAKVFGAISLQASAVATAVHRPRDICIIMDLSGSMSFDSLLGGTYYGARSQSLNPDNVYPKFGHYSGYIPDAGMGVVLSDGEVLGLSNIAVDTDAGTAIVNDFYQNALGGYPTPAFGPAPDAYATTPGGDVPLRKSNNSASAAYAATVADVLGATAKSSQFESNGYSWGTLNGGASKTFQGYTAGPRYWGKTFFIWPPDPRDQYDWRKKFFLKADGVTPLDSNAALWSTGSNPTANPPRAGGTTNFVINYAAILRWLKTTGPNPFPTQLRAGRISYYTAIPDLPSATDGVNAQQDTTFNARFAAESPSNLNERFWKQYIDFVLGFQQSGSDYSVITPNVGYGDDFAWGALSISGKPGGGDTRYMNYQDNPPRPKTRFWFGPMTLVDFIDNYNQDRRWMPGTAHQAPLWGCKIGMRAAMLDIQKNHPNDHVALSFFNTPAYSAGDGGMFNRVRAPLGRNYQRMIDSLFYPQATIDNPGTYPEINCYDSANMLEAPRAGGSTTPAISFMHAYNQFSSNPSLVNYNPSPAPPGDAGGLGRIGAQKMIMFMTDGVANNPADAAFFNQGPYQSYYRVRIPGEYPNNSTGSANSVEGQLYAVANQICAKDTASPPGYASPRKPVLIHSIAFGSLFDPSVASAGSAARDFALKILQNVQYIGSTQSDPNTPLPSYKIITGTSSQRVTLMQQCFQKIMQDNISVTIIE